MLRNDLQKRFQKQTNLAESYSPLYHHLFGIISHWLETRPNDPVLEWLLEISQKRKPIEVMLLLMAGLHRDILLHEPGTADLAAYYPSVGGTLAPNGRLSAILYATIQNRQDSLAPFIQDATVQTNETGRGIFWLLPTLLTNWQALHLVDLGASAGLNLVADQRSYTITDPTGHATRIGKTANQQFATRSNNIVEPHWINTTSPTILSRTGCDLRPFLLETAVDQAMLTSYLWADQLPRIERLKEGIAAFKEVNTHTSIALHATNLPDELPSFLDKIPTTPNTPIVVYNTFMTVYLRDHGNDLQQHIADWAAQHNHTVLWAQAEPLWGDASPPIDDWCAWTVDLWQGSQHNRWHIAWVHPHGTAVSWQETAFSDFVNYFKITNRTS